MADWRNNMGTIMLLFIFVIGCSPLAPPLSPVAKLPVSTDEEVIQVVVKPIVTKGFRSEDEQKWGIDLSAYYTAFEVRVINRTGKEIFLNPSLARLTDETNESHAPLDEKESIQHYMKGNGDPIITLVPKPRGVVEEETGKIINARLAAGTILPGKEKEGLLLFNKISPQHCRKVVLELNGITVVLSGERKNFSFQFACDH
jgi:hypothetical protein